MARTNTVSKPFHFLGSSTFFQINECHLDHFLSGWASIILYYSFKLQAAETLEGTEGGCLCCMPPWAWIACVVKGVRSLAHPAFAICTSIRTIDFEGFSTSQAIHPLLRIPVVSVLLLDFLLPR